MESTNLNAIDQNQMNDLRMGHQRRHGYSHSGNIHFLGTNIAPPNISALMPHSVHLDSHYLLDAHDNIMVHRMPQYIALNPSSSTAASLNHRTSHQQWGSSASPVSGTGTNRRKNAKGRRGNHQHFNASASSSVPPSTASHTENGIPLVPEHNVRSRLSEPVMVHDLNHLIQENYLVQHFQPAAPSWLNQQTLPMPYVQVPNANASLGRRYLSSSRGGFRHPHPVNIQHRNFQYQPQPVQGMRVQPVSFRTPVSTSHRVPTNLSRSASMAVQNALEVGPRHAGPMSSLVGAQVYRPHRRNMHGPTLTHQNLPGMTLIQVDEAALLADHHIDMRMDIEDMSYEELLALGERIGNVKPKLSETMIYNQMKTRIYAPPTDLEKDAYEGLETDCCIICQDEYKKQEKIGILQCGHEYHAHCLTKWLLEKNVCPMCKAEGLSVGDSSEHR